MWGGAYLHVSERLAALVVLCFSLCIVRCVLRALQERENGECSTRGGFLVGYLAPLSEGGMAGLSRDLVGGVCVGL